MLGGVRARSFWWPTEINVDLGFHFLNYTIKETNLGPRAPQRIYLDVGESEEDPDFSR